MSWNIDQRMNAEISTLRLFSLLVSLRIIDAHYGVRIEDLKRLSMMINYAKE